MRRAAPALAAVALLLLPLLWIEPRTYVTLTVAGLAMGMLLFLVASGLSLIFGLMDVLNFAHGALFSWGAFAGFSAVVLLDRRLGWASAPSPLASLGLLVAAVLAAALVAAALGVLLERVVVRPVYGQHLFQILITLGATIVLEELIRIAWGPNDQVVPLPVAFQGSWDLADVIVLRFPVAAIGLGLLVYAGLQLVLTRTRVGLIVRAGVENGEMVQAMGHDLRRYFTARVRRRLRARGGGRRHVGLLRPVGAPRDGRRAADLRVHRRHHRRARQRHRLPGRRPPGGPLVQLRGVPGPEGRPRREHGAHGAGPAAAADRPVRRPPMSRGPMRPGPWLGLGLVALFALVPLAAGSFRTIDLALKIALFGTLAASYDILLGYTGIVSFGHAMFFGLGAYAVALALGKLGAVTYGHLALGLVAGPVAAAGVSLLVGLFSLRVQAIFFAMVTLAFAEFAVILAVQLSPLTGGEDGLNLRLPGVLAARAGRAPPRWESR